MTMLHMFLALIPSIYACIESRYPVYVCTSMGTDYYSPCMSDIASNWMKVDTVCPKEVTYYTAECIEDIMLNITRNKYSIHHITPHVKIGYHRAWWAHRIRPMTDVPKEGGVYQSIRHSHAVKQDLLCIKSCYNCIDNVKHLLR